MKRAYTIQDLDEDNGSANQNKRSKLGRSVLSILDSLKDSLDAEYFQKQIRDIESI